VIVRLNGNIGGIIDHYGINVLFIINNK